MSQIAHTHRRQASRTVVLFAGILLCSLLAGFVQKACWISHLRRSGYGLSEVFVPFSEWLTYHTTAPGLVLDVAMFGPWIALGGWLWLRRTKPKD